MQSYEDADRGSTSTPHTKGPNGKNPRAIFCIFLQVVRPTEIIWYQSYWVLRNVFAFASLTIVNFGLPI